MKFRLFYKNFLLVLVADILLLTFSLYLAYLIRFDFEIPIMYWKTFIQILPIVLPIKIAIFYFLDLYRGMWRYTSISDLLNIIKASSLSSLIIVSLILFGTRFEGFPRSVFIIDWCFTILFISGYRLFIRLFIEYFSEDKPRVISIWKAWGFFNRKRADDKRLLIIGAGNCGEKIYREIRDALLSE